MIVLLEPAQILLTLKAGEQIRHPKLADALRRAGVAHTLTDERSGAAPDGEHRNAERAATNG
jgi:hypothetical protein